MGFGNEKYIGEYAEFLCQFLKPEKSIRVVFDCSNGTTGEILGHLETGISKNKDRRIEFMFINERPDGNFPGHGPDPLKEGALDGLKKKVLKEGADLGIVFDADGDRMFLMDNKGRLIANDADAYLLVQYLKPRKVVADQRIGWLIRKAYKQRSTTNNKIAENTQIIDSRVGHYFVKKLMKEKKADLGIEETGHYYFRDFFGMDSGILAAIYAINAVSRLPYALADFCDLLPQYARTTYDLQLTRFDSARRATDNQEKILKTIYQGYKERVKNVSKLDGIKMEFGHVNNASSPIAPVIPGRPSEQGAFWFDVRASNTEPVLRVVMEADTQKTLDRELKKLTALIKSATN